MRDRRVSTKIKGKVQSLKRWSDQQCCMARSRAGSDSEYVRRTHMLKDVSDKVKEEKLRYMDLTRTEERKQIHWKEHNGN